MAPVRELVRTTDLEESAVRLFTNEMHRAVRERGRFVVALSGGSTPLGLFGRLAGLTELPWERAQIFWGDERFVPHDHPDSNYRVAREAFIDSLPLTAKHVHPWPQPKSGGTPGAEEHHAAAAAYARTLRQTLGEPATFDLQLLGLGSDGHTASIYPGNAAVHAPGLTVATRPAAVPQPRLSLTTKALSNSRTVAFLVSGEQKRAAFESTLAGSGEVEKYPARGVTALERIVWLTDLTLTTG